MSVCLLLGGARSGKSALAERWAKERSGQEKTGQVIYIATAEALDDEMAARINHHRARRPAHWITHEAPLHLASTLQAVDAPQRVLIVDCLTLWLSNLLMADNCSGEGSDAPDQSAVPQTGALWAQETSALFSLLPKLQASVFLVANEVGSGIVPVAPLARLFVDEQGRLNQRVAALSDEVWLVVAGLPVPIKRAA